MLWAEAADRLLEAGRPEVTDYREQSLSSHEEIFGDRINVINMLNGAGWPNWRTGWVNVTWTLRCRCCGPTAIRIDEVDASHLSTLARRAGRRGACAGAGAACWTARSSPARLCPYGRERTGPPRARPTPRRHCAAPRPGLAAGLAQGAGGVHTAAARLALQPPPIHLAAVGTLVGSENVQIELVGHQVLARGGDPRATDCWCALTPR